MRQIKTSISREIGAVRIVPSFHRNFDVENIDVSLSEMTFSAGIIAHVE